MPFDPTPRLPENYIKETATTRTTATENYFALGWILVQALADSAHKSGRYAMLPTTNW